MNIVAPEILANIPTDLLAANRELIDSDVFPNLRDLVTKYRPRVYLEIGVQFGCSFVTAMDAADSIECAFGIDLGEGGEAWGGKPGAYQCAIRTLMAMKSQGRWPSLQSLSMFTLDSQKCDRLPFSQKVDLCYVDGDHSPHGCLHDLELVLPQMAPGGVLIVDDTVHHSWLQDVCDEFCADHGYESYHVADTANRGRAVIELGTSQSR